MYRFVPKCSIYGKVYVEQPWLILDILQEKKLEINSAYSHESIWQKIQVLASTKLPFTGLPVINIL